MNYLTKSLLSGPKASAFFHKDVHIWGVKDGLFGVLRALRRAFATVPPPVRRRSNIGVFACGFPPFSLRQNSSVSLRLRRLCRPVVLRLGRAPAGVLHGITALHGRRDCGPHTGFFAVPWGGSAGTRGSLSRFFGISPKNSPPGGRKSARFLNFSDQEEKR